MQEFDEKAIARDLKIDARAVGIPSGAADEFIKCVMKEVERAFHKKPDMTNREFNQMLAKELRKYNPDLAYVYRNRDKII